MWRTAALERAFRLAAATDVKIIWRARRGQCLQRIVNDEESGLARTGHRREKPLRFVAKNNTEIRIFPYSNVSK